MTMKNKQRRAGVKNSTRGLHGGMVNLRDEKRATAKERRSHSRASRVAAARGMEAPAPLQVLSKSAARRQQIFAKQERAQPKPESFEEGADPGAALVTQTGRQRSFHKELDRVIAMSDVLLEVLDARDPIGCRCAALETAALEHRTKKRIVIVLNKADLIPADNLEAWVRYLRRFHPTIAFKATDMGARRRNVHPNGEVQQLSAEAILADQPAAVPSGSRALGAIQSVDDLIQLLKGYSRSDKLLTAITVGVVGYPNVGKSSVINALKRAKAVTTGAMPGVTRSLQVVKLDRKIKLVDCPGVVFSRPKSADEAAEMVLRNALKVETPIDPVTLVTALLRRCSAESLRAHFAIGEFEDASELLSLIALKRGLLRKGGMVDQTLAARVLVQEWTQGGIPYHSEPPKTAATADEGAAILQELAPAFDLEQLSRVRVEPRTGGGSAHKRMREAEDEALVVQLEQGEGEAGSDADLSDDDPSELGDTTMEDEQAYSALHAALRAGSRRSAPPPESTDPNLIRKQPLARKKGENRLEYAVPATQKQMHKKLRKTEARTVGLTQRALGLSDAERLNDAADDQ